MVRRKGTARFFSGMYVFPGGVAEPCDSTDKETVLRELFEEVGVLLGARNKVDAARLSELRKDCSRQAHLFGDIMKELNVDLMEASSRVKPWSHWITPKQEKWRYDTMFFVALLDAAEAGTAFADQDEVFSHVFATPAEFLRRAAAGEIQLPPPTWLTLTELAAFPSVEDILNHARTMVTIEPTLLFGNDGQLVVALPGDREHETNRGTGLRRIVKESGSSTFSWIDTVGQTTVPHSSL